MSLAGTVPSPDGAAPCRAAWAVQYPYIPLPSRQSWVFSAINRLLRKPSLVYREILRFAHDDRSLNHVLQFANVTRPGIRLKQVQTLLVDTPYILSYIPRATIQEIIDQHRNVCPAFPQRRNLKGKNVEPVKKVATKGAGIDR